MRVVYLIYGLLDIMLNNDVVLMDIFKIEHFLHLELRKGKPIVSNTSLTLPSPLVSRLFAAPFMSISSRFLLALLWRHSLLSKPHLAITKIISDKQSTDIDTESLNHVA